MKKVVIFGGAGTIGLCLIKYLLVEGKYEISVVDLKNKKNLKKLKKYKRRVNVILIENYDNILIDALVKTHDYIVCLATCLPPLASLKEGLSDSIEYDLISLLCKSINYYNVNARLIYGSSTSIYKDSSNKISIDKSEYFENTKIKCENLIMKKCKNYCIIRVPLVLSNLNEDPFIYNIEDNDDVECITKEDAAYAFCKSMSKANNMILDIGGIKEKYKYIVNGILKYYGLSFSYVLNKIFIPKTYVSPFLKGSSKSNELLEYKNDSLDSYFMRLKRNSKNRKANLFLGKIVLKFRKDK